MKTKEKIPDNSIRHELLRKSMSGMESPYDSERHRLAREYLKEKKIDIKPLRVSDG